MMGLIDAVFKLAQDLHLDGNNYPVGTNPQLTGRLTRKAGTL